jgi:hypothetical protein
MPASMRPHLGLAAAGLAVLVLGFVPLAGAHNPAETIHQPTPLGDELVVLGGEASWAYLTPEGETTGEGNLSTQGEVLGSPAAIEGQAAALVRTTPGTALQLWGFGPEGPTWDLEVEPAEAQASGYVLADEDGFAVFTSEARQLRVSAEGEIVAEIQLPGAPAAEPVPAPAGGWWMPLADELVRLEDGEVVQRWSFEGRPTDVTTDGERVIASLASLEASQAELVVLADGEPVFNRSVDALRIGASPAVVNGTLVAGTFSPDGARLLAFDVAADEQVWSRSLGEATAAAVTGHEGRLYAVASDALLAYTADGERLWWQDADPYLASPGVVGDLVVPSAADNELAAYALDGSPAWTYTDGVDMPPWTHHGGSGEEPADGGGEQPSEDDGFGPALWIAAGAAAVAVGALGAWLQDR